MNRILRNERTQLHPSTLDALMRLALNINDVKTWNPNPYTKQFNERDNKFLCDSPFAGDKRKKITSTEEMEDYNISPYSTIF